MVPLKSRTHSLAQSKQMRDTNTSDNNPPRFSFRYLVKHPDFCYESLDKIHKIALIDTLFRLSQLTWSVLRNTQYHGLGYEKIDRKTLKFDIPSEIPNEYNIIAFRFYGKAPMLGYRSINGTFYIVAFDSKFLAYKH